MENKELLIIGRRWQDSNGNTYHTSEIIGGDIDCKSKIRYGYGNQFMVTAEEEIKAQYNKDIKDYNVTITRLDVNRKMDL